MEADIGSLINLVGKRFGRLVVEEYLGNGTWRCTCDCGNTKVAKGRNLRDGSTKSCGCLLKDMPRYRDLTSMRFGSLTVTSLAEIDGHIAFWNCKCDCGESIVVSSSRLRSGHTTACKLCMSRLPLEHMRDREWRDVGGFEGLYAVSDRGDVYSYRSRRLLKPIPHNRGYLRVDLHGVDGVASHYIHRLVATAFLDNPEGLPEVNHIDGNKRNNCIENLEWVTARENYDHALQHHLYQRGEDRPHSKLTVDDVRFIRSSCIKFDPEFGIKPLAEMFGVSSRAVGQIVNGKNWTWVE